MKQNKGFTLIEMLVVVGMIGVLAAAVLTALGPSRQKARDTRVISGLNQLAAVAETGFNGASYPNETALKALPGGTAAWNDVIAIAPSAPVYTIGTSSFVLYAALPAGGFYCVSGTGVRRTTTSTPTGDCQ